jgi:hypothetical protein
MQFGGSGVTSDTASGSCITIKHRATQRLLCINSLQRKTFLPSPNHRTLRISLWVTFRCSLLLEWAQGNTVCNHGGHQIECDDRIRKIPKEAFRWSFLKCQERMSARALLPYFEGEHVNVAVWPTTSAFSQFWELLSPNRIQVYKVGITTGDGLNREVGIRVPIWSRI